MTNTHKENSQEEKRMAVCIFQKCCSSMSGLIFSSRIFFAPQGMESISHPFKPRAGLCVCVCVCVCVCALLLLLLLLLLLSHFSRVRLCVTP